jgi:hypothetical protein
MDPVGAMHRAGAFREPPATARAPRPAAVLSKSL